MTSAAQSKAISNLTVGSILPTGEGLPIPKCFWPPGGGNLSVNQGYFGTGAAAGYATASLVAGPGLAPFTSNMIGVNIVTGSHITNGVRITNGVDLMSGGVATVASAVWKCLSSTASINGKTFEVAMGKGIEMAAGKDIMLSAAKSVDLISGTDVFIDGRPWSTASATWDSKKPFDILHPTKEGHRLRYVCLEGPAAEVYVRGKLKDSNVIELPDYWKGLVDEETIGVTLTPIGHWQELFWEKIEWGSRIVVKNNSGAAINCHYVVYGERKDTSKNIPEYRGLTPMDYPGDNGEYNLNR